jgi:hypothetical protein
MYGWIARVRLKPGILDPVRLPNARPAAERAPDGLALQHIDQAAADRHEVWSVAGLASCEAYRRRADRPEQL